MSVVADFAKPSSLLVVVSVGVIAMIKKAIEKVVRNTPEFRGAD